MDIPKISDAANAVIIKLQKNLFTCLGCGEKTLFYDNKHTPTTPCEHCGDIKWKIFLHDPAICDKYFDGVDPYSM